MKYKVGDKVRLTDGQVCIIKTVWKGILADKGKIDYEMNELPDVYFTSNQIKCKMEE